MLLKRLKCSTKGSSNLRPIIAIKRYSGLKIATIEIWLLDKTMHLANLTRIQQEARAKGQFGVAAKCEELKGKVQGFYVERNLTLTRELSEEDIHSQMQSMFRSREEFRASQEDLEEELFGKEKTVEEDKS